MRSQTRNSKMLVNADWRGLEVLGAAYLSKCPVLSQELIEGVDLHARNQAMLGFPEGDKYRTLAKVFVFRLIYGGTGYSYAHDSGFSSISDKPGYWDDLIREFYSKYYGLKRWHDNIVEEVMRTGELTIPSGRVFKYQPEYKRGLLT